MKFSPHIPIFNYLPIYDLPECGEMSGSAVLVVEIVGMFPYIEGQKRFQALNNWIGGAWFLCDNKLTICISGEPNPSRTKETYTFCLKLCLESIQRSPLLLYLRSQCPVGA